MKFCLRSCKLSTEIGETLTIFEQNFVYLKKGKYLGIILDQSLKFTDQFRVIKARLFYYLKLFKFLQKFLNKKILTTIYKTFILPKVEYCNIAYFHTNKIWLLKIEKVHKRILSFTHSDVSLSCRLFITRSLFIYKLHLSPVGFDFFYFQRTNRLCSRILYILPNVKREKFKSCFAYWGVNVSNFLHHISQGSFLLVKIGLYKKNLHLLKIDCTNF